MDVEKFLEKIKTRPVNHKGKLAMWHEDILKLRRAGCTYAQIVEYLELKDVQVSISAIQSFCRKHYNNAKPTEHHDNKTVTEPSASPKHPSPTKVTEDDKDRKEKVPQHKRLPSWANIPGVESIDDLY